MLTCEQPDRAHAYPHYSLLHMHVQLSCCTTDTSNLSAGRAAKSQGHYPCLNMWWGRCVYIPPAGNPTSAIPTALAA
jgi:hypothetical protein